jgi:hypothetical protein
VAQPIFVETNMEHSPGKKLNQNDVLLLYFSKKLSKVNNRPIGENSPNLVTLNADKVT